MSWFKRSRASNGSAEPSPTKERSDTDPDTCLEVFRNHWQQASVIINRKNHGKDGVTSDEVETVIHNFGQMITLLVREEGVEGMPGPILHFFLEKDILELFCSWCAKSNEYAVKLKHEQLRMFEMLISQSKQLLLIHKSVIRPLLKLLSSCTEGNLQSSETYDIEHQLVLVLHQACVCISQQLLILESFFCTNTDHGPTRFLIFSLLIPYVHREGPVGQHARDALLLIMTLSAKHPHIGQYIATNSDFCPVLAAGLSGLYSSLPRKIPNPSDHWYILTNEDCNKIPELQMFLNSLEFCNAVVQIAHSMVKEQLTKYIYDGFLLPVLGPALHQDITGLPIPLLDTTMFANSRDEVTTATAYLDLFLRRLTEPALIRVFLVFILTDKYDEIVILESLITRINSSSRLSLVSLALFKTLVELHCEDVMFQLVFKFLIPCTHVMVSQRRAVKDLDMYSKSAERFLSLKPSCCMPDTDISHHTSLASSQSLNDGRNGNSTNHKTDVRSISEELKSQETSYMDYLVDARGKLVKNAEDCRCWSAPYNGENPTPDSLLDSTNQIKDRIVSNHSQFTNNSHSVADTSNETLNSTATNGERKPYPQVKLFAQEIDNMLPKLDSFKYNSGDSLYSQGKSCDINKNDSHSLQDGDLTLNSEHCNISCTNKNASLSELYCSLKSNDCFVNFLNIIDDSDYHDSMEQTLETIDFMYSSFGMSANRGAAELGESLAISEESEISKSKPVEDLIASASVSGQSLPVSNERPYEKITTSTFNPGNTSTPTGTRLKDVSSYVEITISGDNKPTTSTTSKILPDTTQRNLSPVADVTLSQMNRSNDDMSFSLAQSPGGTLLTTSRYSSGTPNIGPFLSALFSKLEGMMQNTLYTNLLLTGILSQLAAYPQPLLRSFLLNHNLVFQPTVKSLVQVLSSVRHKVDTYSYAVGNFSQLLVKAKKNLYNREDVLLINKSDRSFSNPTPTAPSPTSSKLIETTSIPDTFIKEKRRMTLTDLLFRKSSPKSGRPASLSSGSGGKGTQLQRVPLRGGVGYRYINSKHEESPDSPEGSIKTWNAVYCAIVLEEFLKELAALAQEHAVLHLDENCNS
ncbi:FHF complex subunit HOOK-interacting protein 1B isoform X3 [Patella vulgata]|uniref:FHF complex subunit HOOK-interacting protein 1B isoform X3 n=1 Tax=Patella vulgata TaxID=6465 RepID=UPI0024A9874D|nr:FHF complex subunit HOOK-interacting protein 1B isoform X3 [Patella vulgata]